MQSILRQGEDFIVWVQQFQNPALNTFFEVFTLFGGHGYLLMVPLVLWSVNHRLGWQLLLVFSATAFVNFLLKDAIGLPRPFEVDPRIISDGELGYALPSGHAQLVVVFWGMLAAWIGRNWFWGLAVAIMFLMGFSRIYLGVHYPTDVLLGWALGVLSLWAWWRWQPAAADRLAEMSRQQQGLLLLAVVVALVLLSALLGAEAGTYGAIGLLVGAAGAMIVSGGVLQLSGGVLWQRAARFVLGAVLLLVLLRWLPVLTASLPESLMAATVTVLLGLFLVTFPLLAARIGLDRPY